MLNTKPMLQARCLFGVAPMACTLARTAVPIVDEVILRPRQLWNRAAHPMLCITGTTPATINK